MLRYKQLNINDIGYPVHLKNIDRPPSNLYFYGDLSGIDFINSFSIVGSRNATQYGQESVEWIVSGLRQKADCIVSGFALGIDTIVHKACIKYGIRTIAVMPLGIDRITPYSNRELYHQILKNNGIILAEDIWVGGYNKYFYPRRNRIIAGLSMTTIVIEAGVKSGAVTTADLAFNENRQVLAVPGRVDMEYSKGTNDLIRDNKAELLNDLAQIK